MVYRTIGIMSGSSLDGLDIAYVEFQETSGKWNYEIKATQCCPYSAEWTQKLKNAIQLPAFDYQLLHTEFGHYIGEQVNNFIETHSLQYQVQVIASHGHTTFQAPAQKMTAQLGDGAASAAITGINVVSDLRAMDVALGGQGAPIVPIGEKLLFDGYDYLLNIGGIANISFTRQQTTTEKIHIAFDVCPANRVLNMLSKDAGKNFDDGGIIASKGEVNDDLLLSLNNLEYYSLPYPKSLPNSFGTDVVYPLINMVRCDVEDGLRTYIEHICIQIRNAVLSSIADHANQKSDTSTGAVSKSKLLITGGGAHNTFLIERLKELLKETGLEVVVPDKMLVDFKEAMVMALIGVLRWREEKNVLASVTGATRDSIGGAVWIGQEA